MQKLVDGVHNFQSTIFPEQQGFFERLAAGQAPLALFVTCSDSRVNPNLITQTDPGDLFIHRNVGNIIPPYGASQGGEGATIEYAIEVLGIRDIIICGHSRCGAMAAVVGPDLRNQYPSVANWLSHADATRRILRDKYHELADDRLLSVAVQENVLVQLENLRTHPAVAAGLARGRLKLHGWVYKIETGQVFAYQPDEGQFVSLLDRQPVPMAANGTSVESLAAL
jgi:carbonic anhydrase